MDITVLQLFILVQLGHSLSGATGQPAGLLHCYGDNFLKVIGGSRSPIGENFTCSECTGATLICSNNGADVSNLDTCAALTSTQVHLFQNKSLLQSLPLIDCIPQHLVYAHENLEWVRVQCQSSPPNFYPRSNFIQRSSATSWENTFHEGRDPGASYASAVNNAIIGRGNRDSSFVDYFISIAQGARGVNVQPDSEFESFSVSFETECDNITGLQRSKPYGEEQYLQCAIDCTKNGERKRWIVTIDDFGDELERYETRYPTGTLRVTPDGRHFVILLTSQIVIEDRYNTGALEAVKNFSSVIANIRFLTDELILLDLLGSDRIVINTTEFFSTTAESGWFTLPGSEMYCANKVCPTVVVAENRYLTVFVKDGNSPYIEARTFDLEDPLTAPYIEGKMLAVNIPQVCFRVGSTPSPPTERPTTPSSTTPASESVASAPTSDTTTSSSETSPSSVEISTGQMIGIVVGVLAGIGVLIVAVAVLAVCVVVPRLRRKPKMKKEGKLPTQETYRNNTHAPMIHVTPAVSSNSNSSSRTPSPHPPHTSKLKASDTHSSNSDSDYQSRSGSHSPMSSSSSTPVPASSASSSPSGSPVPPRSPSFSTTTARVQQDGAPGGTQMVV